MALFCKTLWQNALGVSVYCCSGLTGTRWYMGHWLALIKNVVSFALQTIDGKKASASGLMNYQHTQTGSARWKNKLSEASLCSARLSYCMEMVLSGFESLIAQFGACLTVIHSVSDWPCVMRICWQPGRTSVCWSHYTSHVCFHPHWIECVLWISLTWIYVFKNRGYAVYASAKCACVSVAWRYILNGSSWQREGVLWLCMHHIWVAVILCVP